MKRTVLAVVARRQLGELLNCVSEGGDAVVIERLGKPVAVLVTVDQFQIMERNRSKLFAMIDKIHERTKDIPEQEIQDAVDEAVAAVRKEARRSTVP